MKRLPRPKRSSTVTRIVIEAEQHWSRQFLKRTLTAGYAKAGYIVYRLILQLASHATVKTNSEMKHLPDGLFAQNSIDQLYLCDRLQLVSVEGNSRKFGRMECHPVPH